MPTAGTVDTAQVELVVYAGDTAASLIVRHPGTGELIPYTPVKADGGRYFRARVPYPVPGVWWHGWTITGTGEGFRELYVPVGPAGPAGDTRHTYASTVDLATALHDAPPVDAELLLRNASADLDDLLLTAVYDVDQYGMPTPDALCPDGQTLVKDALRDAVCQIVQWRIATGDTDGAASVYTSASVAGVNLSRRDAGGTASKPDRIGDNARGVISRAGLLSHGPYHFG
jgi:hypothetical protein